MKFLVIFVLALATASAYETPVPFREVPFDAEIEDRIIGGEPAQEGQIPYQCGLLINGGSWCGCSLISKDYALTAAHCTSGLSFATIFLGDTARTGGTSIDCTNDDVIQNADYNPNNFSNDISLIKLRESITFSKFIQPVELPEIAETYLTYAGALAQISGWGKTSDSSSVSSQLMYADVTIITNTACANVYGNDVVNQGVICAETETNRKSTCNGDSGGPIVVNGQQVGVVSYGAAAGCTLGYPVGFARVTFFRKWISDKSDV